MVYYPYFFYTLFFLNAAISFLIFLNFLYLFYIVIRGFVASDFS